MTKNHKLHIRKGDTVKINAGNFKNKTGEVIAVYPKKQRATVKGINLLTHYIKPTQEQPKGGLKRVEGPIHISNLTLLDPKTKKPTRITRKKDSKGKLQRYAKKTGNLL